MYYSRTALILFVISLITLLIVAFPRPRRPFDFQKEKAQLTQILHEEGSKKMYTFFKTQYQPYDRLKVHVLAHWVGEKIYEEVGMEGFSLCDDAFLRGCYHGFIAAAFEAGGKERLAELEQSCETKKSKPMELGGCVHGLGHGLMSLGEYSFDDLVESLRDCYTLHTDDSKKNCANGVFMEYNIRMFHSGRLSIREVSNNDYLYPCRQLPETYQNDCSFALPLWWTQVIPNEYQRYGALCNGSESCYKGIGRAAVFVDSLAFKKLHDYCNSIQDVGGKTACRDSVTESLYLEKIHNPLQFCDEYQGVEKQSCQKHGKEYSCNILHSCSL